MDRKSGRALAVETLGDLVLFDAVYDHEPDAFEHPIVATVHAKSLGVLQDARGDFDNPAEIWVSIYVRRAPGTGASVEDLLDDLTRQAMRALRDAFYDHAANLQIGPSQSGTPQQPIGGKNYRIERFAVRFDDNED